MADIFISYVREDIDKAKLLDDALQREGWAVWRGSGVLHGASLDEENKRELQAARCVIVLWSKASMDQPLVIAETYHAMGRGTLLPVRLDDVKPPLRLRRIRTESLAGWVGDPSHPIFRKLFGVIRERTGLVSATPPGGSLLDRQPPRSVALPPVEETPVAFTVYHPRRIFPDDWSTLLAYAHLPDVRAAVDADSKERLDKEGAHEHESAASATEIARGATITIVPELPGCQFNPPYMPILWLEDWHRAEFKARASSDVPGFALGKAVNGRVAFYLESVLVGEVPIWALLRETVESADDDDEQETASAPAYRAIFASYSHQDTDVVEALENAYKALGMTFFRDVESLRSGEEWNPALLDMIEKADIFQLYWSEAPGQSQYVEQEWRHALVQERQRFIRPVYWRKPMPAPPKDLSRLHFAFLPRK